MPNRTFDAVVSHPTPTHDEILVSFKQDGQPRNVIVKDVSIRRQYDEHLKRLDNLAEEYSQKRQAIADERGEIDKAAFDAAEKQIKATEDALKRQQEAEAQVRRDAASA